ncbi:MAG: hypothetical protein QM296_07645 [Bacillota bacterium]|nr:hypothetical protein [Bacillota bacterium]
MVKVIIGPQGSGKTGRLIDAVNQYAGDEAAKVVLIEHGRRLDRVVSHRIRLVEITEYPINGYDSLLGFVGGLCAMDYDLTDIYIDSLFKVAGSDDLDEAACFLEQLEVFSEAHDVDIHLIISMREEDVPEVLHSFEHGEL